MSRRRGAWDAGGKGYTDIGDPPEADEDGVVDLAEGATMQTTLPDPSILPELRVHLRRMWSDGEPFAAVASHIAGGPPSVDKSIASRSITEWERKVLDQATLWWVSADMVQVLLNAASGVPDDVEGGEVVPLAPAGLVALETPWYGVSSTPGQEKPVQVNAFLWGPTILPPLEDRPHSTLPAYSLSSYTCFAPDEERRTYARGYTLRDQLWAPLGRSDWPLDDALATPPWPMSDQTRESFIEDRRIWAALMTVLAHDGIATQTLAHAPRAVRRRAERVGEPRMADPYKVVTLRTLRVGQKGEPTEGKRGYDYRFPVSGHWKRVAYGPNHSLRRLQWLDPYTKGPEDKPLRVRQTIRAWKR